MRDEQSVVVVVHFSVVITKGVVLHVSASKSDVSHNSHNKMSKCQNVNY